MSLHTTWNSVREILACILGVWSGSIGLSNIESINGEKRWIVSPVRLGWRSMIKGIHTHITQRLIAYRFWNSFWKNHFIDNQIRKYVYTLLLSFFGSNWSLSFCLFFTRFVAYQRAILLKMSLRRSWNCYKPFPRCKPKIVLLRNCH